MQEPDIAKTPGYQFDEENLPGYYSGFGTQG